MRWKGYYIIDIYPIDILSYLHIDIYIMNSEWQKFNINEFLQNNSQVSRYNNFYAIKLGYRGYYRG